MTWVDDPQSHDEEAPAFPLHEAPDKNEQLLEYEMVPLHALLSHGTSSFANRYVEPWQPPMCRPQL